MAHLLENWSEFRLRALLSAAQNRPASSTNQSIGRCVHTGAHLLARVNLSTIDDPAKMTHSIFDSVSRGPSFKQPKRVASDLSQQHEAKCKRPWRALSPQAYWMTPSTGLSAASVRQWSDCTGTDEHQASSAAIIHGTRRKQLPRH